MKKSAVLRKMLRILKTWEGSRLEIRTAKEVLGLLEDEGVISPPTTVIGYALKRETGELIPVHSSAWDKEGKKCEELEIIYVMV